MTAKALRWPGFLLGFSLGGFFDGILLHQVLQWHHLLSNVEALGGDLRSQVMADGLFHALMYLIAAVALHQLWRRRLAAGEAGAGPVLWGLALIGFGAWHVVDAVFSHWITGIHRIRVDSPNPLAWDLLWFLVFGVVPALAGWRVLRRAGRGGGPGSGRAAAASLAVAALACGPLAALPAAEGGPVMVLFAPGVSPAAAFGALARADARVLWVDRSGGLWAVAMDGPGRRRQLYRSGALLVGNSAVAFGCFSWSRPAPSALR
jgi:uncharacterized membrane protein